MSHDSGIFNALVVIPRKLYSCVWGGGGQTPKYFKKVGLLKITLMCQIAFDSSWVVQKFTWGG